MVAVGVEGVDSEISDLATVSSWGVISQPHAVRPSGDLSSLLHRVSGIISLVAAEGRRTAAQKKVKKSVGSNPESGCCVWQGGRLAGCPCCRRHTSVQKCHKVSSKIFFFSVNVASVEAAAGCPSFSQLRDSK